MMEEPNFERHIPGQSLTSKLGQYPWQRPAQYTNVDDAMQFYAERIMNPLFRDQIAETMELGVPLTSIANALQGNGVMMGKHTIDVGVLILPVIMEMLAYIGDEEGVDYVMGTELEDPDEDKTVLTCLTAKSISESCNVVAHVLDVENVSHLQRANANEIVIPDEHVPHLLAKHVTDPGVPQFFDDLILKEEEDKGLQEVKIPKTLNGQTHNKISAFYKFRYGWLLVGYAIRKAGFSLDEQMGEGGSPLIRNMIKEQLDGAGISLSSDEHVVVEINPKDDYTIDEKHSALVLR